MHVLYVIYHQNKLYDDMQHENATLKTELHQLNRRYDEEMKAARQKIGELQAIIDSITEHLQVPSEDHDHFDDDEDHHHHSLDDDYHRMDSTDYTNSNHHHHHHLSISSLPSPSTSYRGEPYGSQEPLPPSSSSSSSSTQSNSTYLSRIFNNSHSHSDRYQQQQQQQQYTDDDDDLVLVLNGDDINTYDEYDASNLSTYNDDYNDVDDGSGDDGANTEDKEDTQASSKSQKTSISRHNSQRSKNSVHFPFDDNIITSNNSNINSSSNINNNNNNINSSPHSRSSSFSPMKSTVSYPISSSSPSSPSRSFLLSPSSRSTSFIVDQYERNIPSVQYTRLVQGIKLVTCMISYLSKDELQVRNYLTQCQISCREQMDIDNRTIQNLLDYQGHLEDNSRYLKSSMEFTKEMECKSSENYQLLDDDYQAMKVQYNHLLMKEQSMKGHDSKYEQMYQDIKVLYEKLKLEKKLCLDDHLDVSIKNMQLSSKIDDLEESNSVLQSQVELVRQDLGIIRIERDELMKHFLRQGSNNNNNYNNNNSGGGDDASNNVTTISSEYKLSISPSGKSMEDYRRDVQQHLIITTAGGGGGSSPTVPSINRAVVWTSPLRSNSSGVD